ncbi:hypothetical protein ACK3TF_001357 [Chlorella vulgaris]
MPHLQPQGGHPPQYLSRLHLCLRLYCLLLEPIPYCICTVQVRPPLRGLLKVLQASHPGTVLLNMQKHLVSGHWVLSFPDGDRAASAQQHVEEWAHRMRAVYCQLLHPLLSIGAGDGSDAGSAGVGSAEPAVEAAMADE